MTTLSSRQLSQVAGAIGPRTFLASVAAMGAVMFGILGRDEWCRSGRPTGVSWGRWFCTGIHDPTLTGSGGS
jgi:hypothetical protein